MKNEKGPLDEKVDAFLFKHWSLPNVSGRSPAEDMFGRKFRTRLDVLLAGSQMPANNLGEGAVKVREFHPGQDVWVRFFLADSKWLPGKIIKRL